MSPIEREDPRFAKQLNKLDLFNQFLCDVASVIVSGNDSFESVWTIANQVYDRHYSAKVTFMTRSGLDESGRTALSA
jgi:hypothetical protein